MIQIERLVSFLAPRLTVLIESETNANQSIGSDDQVAKQIWHVLSPQLLSRDVARAAIEKVSGNPSDSSWKDVLKMQIQEIFASSPNIKSQVETYWLARKVSEEVAYGDSTSISVEGSSNQTIGRISGSARVVNNVGGSIDESQVDYWTDNGSKVTGGNADRNTWKLFSENTIMLVLLIVLSLGGAAWFLGVKLGSDGIEIETQGGDQVETPEDSAL